MFTSWFCDQQRLFITTTKVSLFLVDRRSPAFQKEEVVLSHTDTHCCLDYFFLFQCVYTPLCHVNLIEKQQNRVLLLFFPAECREPELCARFNILIDHFNADGFLMTHRNENETAFFSRYFF